MRKVVRSVVGHTGEVTTLALFELGRPEEALQLNLQTRRSGHLLAVELVFNAYIAPKAGVRTRLFPLWLL